MNQILTNWNFMRGFRLVVAFFALFQGVMNNYVLLILMSVIIGGMAVFNIGCCGANGCQTSHNSSKTNFENKEVVYEEVVSEK